MSSKPNVRLEVALFFAAACFAIIVAANYSIILSDLAGLMGWKGSEWTGRSVEVILLGFLVAMVAYSGMLVVLVPMYAFLVQVLERWGEPPAEPGKEPEQETSHLRARRSRKSRKRRK